VPVNNATPMLLELDGADIHPHTVDPRVAADLLQVFFEMVTRAATVVGVSPVFRGLLIEDKCFQARSATLKPEAAMKVMELVSGWANGTEPTDTQVDRERARKFNALARKLGQDVRAKLKVGQREWALSLSEQLPDLPPAVTTTLRVRLIGLGADPARAKFVSESEEHPFSLTVDVGMAEKLSKHFNRHLDLEFTYRRDRLGKIEDGRIIDFFPMEADDGGEEWLGWLKANGSHWDDVDDPLEELGRRDE
jgi:hypothetical protein